MAKISITVNGEEQKLESGSCVQDFLNGIDRGGCAAGVAVAVNGEIIHRAQYAERRLQDGDALDVVHMTAGG